MDLRQNRSRTIACLLALIALLAACFIQSHRASGPPRVLYVLQRAALGSGGHGMAATLHTHIPSRPVQDIGVQVRSPQDRIAIDNLPLYFRGFPGQCYDP